MFSIPVVHEDVGFPKPGWRDADVLDVTVFSLIPDHVAVVPLLNGKTVILGSRRLQ